MIEITLPDHERLTYAHDTNKRSKLNTLLHFFELNHDPSLFFWHSLDVPSLGRSFGKVLGSGMIRTCPSVNCLGKLWVVFGRRRLPPWLLGIQIAIKKYVPRLAIHQVLRLNKDRLWNIRAEILFGSKFLPSVVPYKRFLVQGRSLFVRFIIRIRLDAFVVWVCIFFFLIQRLARELTWFPFLLVGLSCSFRDPKVLLSDTGELTLCGLA